MPVFRIYSSHKAREVSLIIPTLRLRKLRLRDVK